MDNAVKAATGLLAIGVAVVLFLVLRGGDDESVNPAPVSPGGGQVDSNDRDEDKAKGKPEPPPEPQIPVVEVKAGQVVGGVQELTYQSGSQMRFAVEADVADEAHLHGYDVSEEVGPGKTAQFNLPADIEGVFELELETSGLPIAEISVTP